MIVASSISGLMAAGFAAVGTAAVRHFALRHALLDRPNERSSHSVPVPRGGGLAILVSLLIALLLLKGRPGAADWPFWLALAGIVPTTIAGLIDDRWSIPARVRVLVHCVTALAFVPLALAAYDPGYPLAFWLLGAWWTFATVAAINVVNFMDGIDGIIAVQTIVFGLHLALLATAPETILFTVALAGAAGGFLLWNWPPARIFLGDAGSGSLGALGMIGGLLVLREGAIEMLPVFLPVAPLFADATVTLLRRAARGERLAEAHREHLYQRLANGGWGHRRVTLLYGGLAVAGSVVAQLAGTAVWPALLILYATAVLVVGLILERWVAVHNFR
jgi:Fuc2NAc and GlcNAc transferase